MKVLAELPNITGKFVRNITCNVAGRNMVFLPLTKRAILQYCTKFLVKTLKVNKHRYYLMNNGQFQSNENSFFHCRRKLEAIRSIIGTLY